MTRKHTSVYESIMAFLSSKKFLMIIASFFIFESLWIAFSFRYPMLYDEYAHVEFIKAYASTLMPYSTHVMGNVAMQISVFHYFLGIIYRFFEFLGANQDAIVLILRAINIILVTVGIFIYAKLLKSAGLKQIYINLGLLFFTLLPITPLVAATINYDNLLFPLVALYLYWCVKIIQQKGPSLVNTITLVTIGLFASLVKYEFLPLFLMTIIFIAVFHFRHHGLKKPIDATAKVLRQKNKKNMIQVVSFVVLCFIVIFLYGGSLIKYHKLLPGCFNLKSQQHCMEIPVVARNVNAVATKNERNVVGPAAYTYNIWLKNMVYSTLWSGNSTIKGAAAFGAPLPIMNILLYTGIFVGGGMVLYTWRSIRKSTAWKFLLLVASLWILVILMVNLNGYYTYHAAYAIQPRYLLIVLPILVTLVVYATSMALKYLKRLKLAFLCIILLAFTQGGGVVTHILRAQDSWYWDNTVVKVINHSAKRVISPLVKGA